MRGVDRRSEKKSVEIGLLIIRAVDLTLLYQKSQHRSAKAHGLRKEVAVK